MPSYTRGNSRVYHTRLSEILLRQSDFGSILIGILPQPENRKEYTLSLTEITYARARSYADNETQFNGNDSLHACAVLTNLSGAF